MPHHPADSGNGSLLTLLTGRAGGVARCAGLSARTWRWLAVCLCLPGWLASAGCARWSKEPIVESAARLNPPRRSPDSVVIEATLIRFPEDQAGELAKVWKVVDESVVELSTRRELAANGIRCGVLMGEMPQVIRDRLKELSQVDHADALEHLGLAAEVTSDTLRLHCHAGRRKDLPLRVALSEPLTVLHTERGVMKGATFEQPSVLMDVRAIPLGDGRAKLKLTPEVEHGEPKKRIVSNQLALRTEMRRDQKRWDHLALEATLVQGQFLLCSVTDEPLGVGQALFSTRTNDRTTERVLLVVRLVSTQLDDLFAPEDVEAARLAIERS
jgi:hypothetical protein